MTNNNENKHDFTQLRTRIRKAYGTEAAFTKALEWKPELLESRLTNKTEFTQKEITQIRTLLKLSDDDTHRFFFPDFSPMNQDNEPSVMLELIQKAEHIEDGMNVLEILNLADEARTYDNYPEAVDWVIQHVLDEMQSLRAAMTVEYAKRKDRAAAGA